MLGHGQGVDNIAVGQNHFHAQALVVDLAILGGHDADAAMAQSAADGAAGEAAGDMLAGVALLIGVPLELLEDHAGFSGDGVGVQINGDQLVHTLHIQQNAACHAVDENLTVAAMPEAIAFYKALIRGFPQ